jgi:nitroreductase
MDSAFPIRKLGRPAKALLGFAYHFLRFVRFSAWREDLRDTWVRNYLVAKVYHSLEKSLAFRKRRQNAGHANARLLGTLIEAANRSGRVGFNDQVAPHVLGQFLDKSSDGALISELGPLASNRSRLDGGTCVVTIDDMRRGMLSDPRTFFFSRYSVREFDRRPIDRRDINEAIELATKSPSACNRQPWHVYHVDDTPLIAKALSLQNGNGGFGDGIKNLLVIAADLRAFGPGAEHYQHWIDGGMFSMSLVYAFHAKGLVSCCLNWSAGPRQDLALRALLPINPAHSVVMMLAVGWPRSETTVCKSPRRPLNEFITHSRESGMGEVA